MLSYVSQKYNFPYKYSDVGWEAAELEEARKRRVHRERKADVTQGDMEVKEQGQALPGTQQYIPGYRRDKKKHNKDTTSDSEASQGFDLFYGQEREKEEYFPLNADSHTCERPLLSLNVPPRTLMLPSACCVSFNLHTTVCETYVLLYI